MKRLFLLLMLAAAFTSFTGCINLSFGKHSPPPPPPPEPAVVMPAPSPLTPADAATVAEIDAAARLNLDSARKESLSHVAQRAGLSPTVQVHLINVAYRALSFDSSKVELLRTLIANPAFSDAARQAIVTQLDHLGFDSHKQEILRQLNQRVTSS